jgi:hypothetical protein
VDQQDLLRQLAKRRQPALNLDITQTRTSRTKYGYVFNVEQFVTTMSACSAAGAEQR